MAGEKRVRRQSWLQELLPPIKLQPERVLEQWTVKTRLRYPLVILMVVDCGGWDLMGT